MREDVAYAWAGCRWRWEEEDDDVDVDGGGREEEEEVVSEGTTTTEVMLFHSAKEEAKRSNARAWPLSGKSWRGSSGGNLCPPPRDREEEEEEVRSSAKRGTSARTRSRRRASRSGNARIMSVIQSSKPVGVRAGMHGLEAMECWTRWCSQRRSVKRKEMPRRDLW
ncbi:hypothetical protein MKX07_003916 [Trichoderma sp. CBMAI-0711]|nr:hypothetical protein MKX07_003916 [Trichoderma sp. CBMAI-0711]